MFEEPIQMESTEGHLWGSSLSVQIVMNRLRMALSIRKSAETDWFSSSVLCLKNGGMQRVLKINKFFINLIQQFK